MSEKRNDADVAFIRALAELLSANDLTEIEVDREYGDNDRLSVRVSKELPAPIVQAAPVSYAPAPAAAPAAAAAPAPAAAAVSADPSTLPGVVNSPMVGTAYLAAEPGAAPFVKVGDSVAEGQTVLIIEAMKTMNQIPSPRAGIVKRILVADASPVEYGAPLLVIE